MAMVENNTISVAILTTETIHHAYFIKQIARKYKKLRVFIDTKTIKPPFPIEHEYEKKRDSYEQNEWFLGKDTPKISDFAECVYFSDINSEQENKELTHFDADISIVFGTRKLSKKICDVFSGKLVNLHGGDPKRYRGLDSHLWSLYHRDKQGLMTTLHEINPILDDGKIIQTQSLSFSNIKKLEHIRKENTEVCVNLVLNFLADFEINHYIKSYPQECIGRYYSFMPAVMKEVIYSNFNNGIYDEIFR